ncbi:phage head closure protein [Parabacteroides sp. Marseille-P3160]|uniref:phage head closure protein n=1 Tax=Parabacteroides sp. Marseille-P3160 TaxID=1917887 RepID=UPI0009BB0DCE|nr:phage head closure protein [Parabacteroides sp. Marseille-P3160]
MIGRRAFGFIEVNRPVKTDTDYSGDRVTYELAFKARADILHKAGNKVIDSGEIFSSYQVVFVIGYWYKDRIKSDMQIVYDGKTYEIMDVNPQRAQKQITITAEVINE